MCKSVEKGPLLTESTEPNGVSPKDMDQYRFDSNSRVLTVPNLITVARLCLLPVAIYEAVGRGQFVLATAILVFIGLTDFLDGYVARHFNQVSELGKIIDPSADRIVIIAVGITAIIQGWIPLWLGIVIMLREVFISILSSYLYKTRRYRLDVIWLGKAGTFALLCALPTLVAGESKSPNLSFLHLIGLGLAIIGIVTLYLAAFNYVTKVLIPVLKGNVLPPSR